MTVNLDWVLYLLAAISFGLGAFRVVVARIDWMLLGFLFLTISLMV